jgi:CHAT domain
LLSGEEAMAVFALGSNESFVVALTRDSVDWKKIPLGAEAVTEKVAAGQISSVRSRARQRALWSAARSRRADKRSLLIAPSRALTALPFHLLITDQPAAIPERIEGYREAGWLLKRQAVSVLPSVASLQQLRSFAQRDLAVKPMIGFGDPLFNACAGGSDKPMASRSVTSLAYSGFWQGAGVDRTRLAQALPQLPDTAEELNAVASDLGVPASDIHLGASEISVKRALLRVPDRPLGWASSSSRLEVCPFFRCLPPRDVSSTATMPPSRSSLSSIAADAPAKQPSGLLADARMVCQFDLKEMPLLAAAMR